MERDIELHASQPASCGHPSHTNGTISTSTPAYTWNAVAPHLLLPVGERTFWHCDPNVVHGCSSGLCKRTGHCTLTPSTNLPNAAYSGGSRPGTGWLRAVEFRDDLYCVCAPPPPPPAATLVSPTGTISTSTPTYTGMR